MDSFVASNGTIITTPAWKDASALHISDGSGTLNVTPTRRDALRQFFLEEEDERLGRVRMPEYPDVVIYPSKSGGIWVRFWNQDSGTSVEFNSTSRVLTRPPEKDDTPTIRAARLYFSRLPKPLPTKPGKYGAFELGEDGRWYKVLHQEFTPEYVDLHLNQEDR